MWFKICNKSVLENPPSAVRLLLKWDRVCVYFRHDKSKDKRHEGKRPGLWQRAYSKEITLVLETEDIDGVNAIKLIKEIENVVGPGKLSALRPRPNKQYEATFESFKRKGSW